MRNGWAGSVQRYRFKSCNASGGRRLHEYSNLPEGGLLPAKVDVPRLAEGKCLKLLYELFDEADVLAVTAENLHARFCPECDLGPICQREHSEGKLSPLCLDGVATVLLRNPNEGNAAPGIVLQAPGRA